MPIAQKPSVRNIISSAQEYLTFVEGCPPYAAQANVAQNADALRQGINNYNAGIDGGMGRGMGQLNFEDEHSKKIMQTLNAARMLIQAATMHPEMKNYVVDGGGSEWNRVNPVKLTNLLKDLGSAELSGVGRGHSTYHGGGSKKYEAHGNGGQLKVRNLDQTLSYPKPKQPPVTAPAMKR